MGVGPPIDSGSPMIRILFLRLRLSRSDVFASSLLLLSAKATSLVSRARIRWSSDSALVSSETIRCPWSYIVVCIFSSLDSRAAKEFLRSSAMLALWLSSRPSMLVKHMLAQGLGASFMLFFAGFVAFDIISGDTMFY